MKNTMSTHFRPLRLCLVTDINKQGLSLYRKLLKQAVLGGITMVQLREKNKNTHELIELGVSLKQILDPLKIPLIVNDNVDVANALDAYGVHLGQNDISPDEARQLLRPHKLIGWSVESLADVERANALISVDYIAASATFPSTSKRNCKKIWGLTGLQDVCKLSKKPVVAIGGINEKNIKDVIRHGAFGAAVISAIHQSINPQQASANLMSIIDKTQESMYV